MRERALLIGADLEIGETATGGLSVTVRSRGSSAASRVDDITETVP